MVVQHSVKLFLFGTHSCSITQYSTFHCIHIPMQQYSNGICSYTRNSSTFWVIHLFTLWPRVTVNMQLEPEAGQFNLVLRLETGRDSWPSSLAPSKSTFKVLKRLYGVFKLYQKQEVTILQASRLLLCLNASPIKIIWYIVSNRNNLGHTLFFFTY